MPHDAKGRDLQPGDIVFVPMTVRAVHQGEDYCNLDLETVATMPPANQHKTGLSAINTRMVLRAKRGNVVDNVDFVIVHDGVAVKIEGE